MYNPSHFVENRPEVLGQLIHDHPFGLLISQSDAGFEADTLPFLLDDDGAGNRTLRGHVARANPLWRRAGSEVLVVFQGPQAYVSPAWYPSKAEHGKVVPTWNYVLVQARGTLVAHEDTAWLRQLVGELTDRHESARAQPWQVGDAPADYIDKMLGAIVGVEIPLRSLQGKWKVSQNRPAADRAGVVRGLQAQGDDAAIAMADRVLRGAT
jgi:transcriptional regulator